MTTQQIANRLAELCEIGDFQNAQKELYSDDVVSIEPMETAEYAKETRGKTSVLAKIQKFEKSIDKTYGNKVSTPLVVAGSIAFTLEMDVAIKGKGRMPMKEICVYETKDGKVISEQFFM